MHVVVIGGTRFLGRALLWQLVGSGHEVLLVHRGVHEPSDLPDVPHLHIHRRELARERQGLRSFRADALVDLCAMTGADAEAIGAAVGTEVRLLVASSIEVYRAYTSVMSGTVTDTVPLDEQSPLRTSPPPDRDYVTPGWDYDPRRYEKLDVETAYLARAGRSAGCR